MFNFKNAPFAFANVILTFQRRTFSVVAARLHATGEVSFGRESIKGIESKPVHLANNALNEGTAILELELPEEFFRQSKSNINYVWPWPETNSFWDSMKEGARKIPMEFDSVKRTWSTDLAGAERALKSIEKLEERIAIKSDIKKTLRSPEGAFSEKNPSVIPTNDLPLHDYFKVFQNFINQSIYSSNPESTRRPVVIVGSKMSREYIEFEQEILKSNPNIVVLENVYETSRIFGKDKEPFRLAQALAKYAEIARQSDEIIILADGSQTAMLDNPIACSQLALLKDLGVQITICVNAEHEVAESKAVKFVDNYFVGPNASKKSVISRNTNSLEINAQKRNGL